MMRSHDHCSPRDDGAVEVAAAESEEEEVAEELAAAAAAGLDLSAAICWRSARHLGSECVALQCTFHSAHALAGLLRTVGWVLCERQRQWQKWQAEAEAER